MNTTKLPYADIRILSENIIELSFNEGVEVDKEMVDEIHQIIESNRDDNALLMVNHRNDYDYSFDAQTRLFDADLLDAVALIAYSSVTLLVYRSILQLPSNQNLNVEVFSSRDDGIQWIIGSKQFLNSGVRK